MIISLHRDLNSCISLHASLTRVSKGKDYISKYNNIIGFNNTTKNKALSDYYEIKTSHASTPARNYYSQKYIIFLDCFSLKQRRETNPANTQIAL